MLTSPRILCAVSIPLVLLTLVRPALAAEQETPPPDPQAQATSPPPKKAPLPPPPPEAIAAARAFFEKGEAYYKAGKYQAAWVEFSSAFQIVEMPDLLFNIARCEAKMGRAADAAKHFRQFLAAKPDDPDADNIRKQIDTLEGRTPVATPAPSNTTDNRPLSIPWIATATGGAGVLLVLGGAGALGAASSTYYSLQQECGSSCDRSKTDSGRTQAAVGYSLLAVGFAAMASAAVILPFELKKKDATSKVALRLSPGGLAVQGRF